MKATGENWLFRPEHYRVGLSVEEIKDISSSKFPFVNKKFIRVSCEYIWFCQQMGNAWYAMTRWELKKHIIPMDLSGNADYILSRAVGLSMFVMVPHEEGKISPLDLFIPTHEYVYACYEFAARKDLVAEKLFAEELA
ncbi:hypothetical protein ACFL2B_02935 [Patescibacteria group bacterium]